MKPTKWLVGALWSVVFVLALTGIVSAANRALILSGVVAGGLAPDRFNATGWEAHYAQHRFLTLLHVVPGLLFMVLGPLQFVQRIRSRHIRLHRWSGRVFVASGLLIGVSALRMGFLMPIGGANETAATTFFAVLFLFALSKAFFHIRRREIARHREWMIRAFSIGLAVATMRPLVGLFFFFSHLSVQEFFGITFWIAFTSHLLAAEAWINYTNGREPLDIVSRLG